MMLVRLLLNKNKLKTFFIFSLFIFYSTSYACTLSFRNLSGINEIFLDSTNSLNIRSTFNVDNSDSPSLCDFFVSFATVVGGGGQKKLYNEFGDFIPYEVYPARTQSTILGETGDPTVDSVLQSKIRRRGTTKRILYDFFLPAAALAPAGTYQAEMDISLYGGTAPDTSTPYTTQRVTYTINIPDDIAVYVDTGSGDVTQSEINFGFLTSGASRTFKIKVISNSAYDLTIDSSNQGNLIHKESPTSAPIPYTLSQQGGGTINLSAPATTSYNIPRSGTRSRTFRVTIGTLTNPDAGPYQDNLTITVAAR